MSRQSKNNIYIYAAVFLMSTIPNFAGEALFGKIKLAEPLPKGSGEIYQTFIQRNDKSMGHYSALNTSTEVEYGVTNRFTVSMAVKGQAIDVSGLVVDGYIPGDYSKGWSLSGIEGEVFYNFLSPAKNNYGLSAYFGIDYNTLDPHSGRDKNIFSTEYGLIVQKYFMEGQLAWAGNIAMESTIANRGAIDDLPEDFEWPTFPEVELELKYGMGLSYRFSPGWSIGGELLYEEEHETEVGSERHSLFFGPSLHYANKTWWATATYLTQLYGGGEGFEGQDTDLHLIEKTRNEFKLSVGYNF